MPYVDGFVLPVPKDKIDAYKALAKRAGDIWKEHGALDFVECVGDDVPYPTRRSERDLSKHRGVLLKQWRDSRIQTFTQRSTTQSGSGN